MRKSLVIVVAIALLSLLAACGDDGDSKVSTEGDGGDAVGRDDDDAGVGGDSDGDAEDDREGEDLGEPPPGLGDDDGTTADGGESPPEGSGGGGSGEVDGGEGSEVTQAPPTTQRSEPQPPPPPSSGTGVVGVVVLGPGCPVIAEGQDCTNDPASGARVTVSHASSGARGAEPEGAPVATATADGEGRFEVALSPGEYVATATADGAMSCDTVAFTVGDRYAEIRIPCDTGMR